MAAYGALYAHKSCFDEAARAARALGFSPAGFQDLSGTSAENIARCEKEIESLEKQQEALRRALAEKKDLIADFERIFDYYAMLQEQQEVTERLLVTRKTFYAQGYVPKDRAADLKEGLEARFYCRVELSDVEAGEAFPIAFHNPAPVRPFEVVTEQFSMPGPKDVDPNFLMSIFYFVFFGMMLSDAVYGLLLIAACTFIHFRYKPEGTMGKNCFADWNLRHFHFFLGGAVWKLDGRFVWH